jgi:hypothetical protein
MIGYSKLKNNKIDTDSQIIFMSDIKIFLRNTNASISPERIIE